jgi:hypothetical protein
MFRCYETLEKGDFLGTSNNKALSVLDRPYKFGGLE